jgi:hypothetical protein
MSYISSLSVQGLRKAAALKEKIQSLEKELVRLLGSTIASATTPAPNKKKFRMSAAAKAKISAAAKARWAKVKGNAALVKTAAKPKAVKKAKGKMSAATKAKLSAKLKAIWAKRKAEKK